jgi:dTDP-4-dehydrorhamnose 3,5-epimerase
MIVRPLAIPGTLLFEPKVFGDDRGFFFEAFHAARYAEAGIEGDFVQDNLSRSSRGVLRGLHLQNPEGQGKLVQVLEGEVFDVGVDVRVGSPTFGQHVHAWLSADNHHQLYIPPGFAHGFFVTSETALFAYKCTEYYRPELELGVAWDDPDIGIAWPAGDKTLSPRDAKHRRLADIPREELPRYV